MAGKLEQYSRMPGIVAYQLFVIEDSRTSRICRNLLTQSGLGMILPVDHPFWKKYGFPPYHFQCRSSIRPIFKSMIGKDGIIIDNPSMRSLTKFKPGEGFGGNPLDKESWWRMTSSMAFNAARFNIWNIIEKQAKDNGLKNFALDLVDGTDTQKLEGIKFMAEKAKLAKPLQKEVNLARILTDYGHSWYFTPENHTLNMKNPDGIVDGKISDMKILTSKKIDKIEDRIKECDSQGVEVSIIHITNTSYYTEKEAIKSARNTLKNEVKNVKEVFLVYGSKLSILK